MVLRNITVESRRDEYESGLAAIQTARYILVPSVRSSEVSFARSDIISICFNGETQSWPQLIASRDHEVSNEQEYYSLRADSIEHLWARSDAVI